MAGLRALAVCAWAVCVQAVGQLNSEEGNEKRTSPKDFKKFEVSPLPMPPAYLQPLIDAQSRRHPCTIFGLSFDLQTIAMKHYLLKLGGKCNSFDIDRFNRVPLAAVKNYMDLPLLYISGQRMGSLADVELVPEARMISKLEAAGAMMLRTCPSGLNVVKRPCKQEPCHPTMDVQSYVTDLITSHRCMIFGNTRLCGSPNEDGTTDKVHHCSSGKQDSITSEMENILLEVGAKCDAVDLFKDTMNKPFIRITSPRYLAHMYIPFQQAYFGAKIGSKAARQDKATRAFDGKGTTRVFGLEEASTEGLATEIVYSRTRCQHPPSGNADFMNKIVLIERGGCTFVEKARMIQKAGGVGMIAINTDEKTLPLLGVDGDDDIDIWSMSITKSAGEKIKKAIARTDTTSGGKEMKDQYSDDGRVLMYVEEGGKVERLLEKLRGATKLPELYLDGKRLGDEEDIANMYVKRTLVPKLEKAGAFMLPPDHRKCKVQRMKHLRNALHSGN